MGAMPGAPWDALDRGSGFSMRGAGAVSAALTLGGAGGISGPMNYFNQELVNTMLHLGVDKVAALGREHVTRGPGF
jgi:hypothetical protein